MYLLNFVSHDFSIQIAHNFLLKNVKWRRVLTTHIIQEIISKHYPLCERSETFTVEYILLQTLFILVEMS